MKLSAFCKPRPTKSFACLSLLFPSGLVALQVLAHPSLDFPVLPWGPIPCLYIRVFLLSASILHFVALPKYYGGGEFLSPRKTGNAFSLFPHLIDSFSGQRVLDCKGFILCLWEACFLTSQSCC